MPLPSGLVVKNGSNTRSMISGGMPQPGVGHREHHILARRHLGVARGVSVVERGVAGLDRQLAVPVHRVARIDRQIEQGVLDLRGIDERVPQAAGDDRSRSRPPSPSARRSMSSMPRISRPRLTTLGASGWRRPNASSCEASFAPRERRRSRSAVAARRAGSGDVPGQSCRLPPMTCRTLLKSCATPPVSLPTASIFCAWRSCASASACSATAAATRCSSMLVGLPQYAARPPCAR